MEHSGEVWQELDYNGERLRGIVPAELEVDKVRLFYGAAVMLYRFKDGEVEYLFQHRSKHLRENADTWDVSAGGHVNLNESQIDSAVRETREEIGVDLDKNKLEIAGSYIRWKIFVTLYFYDWTSRPDDFKFNDDEVEEVKWIKASKLDSFWPNLKWTLQDDKLFRINLEDFAERIAKKYENN
ncbi:NUDIX domain-containing protein [Candidatus Saccharibacteria bacterium]|nr:NUDIX domain-containing protein [Candidatus Saccharibacteria bacterium]